MSGASITGRWTGRYSYELGAAPVPFEVVFEDADGDLSGKITEPNTITQDCGDTLTAVLRGRRHETEVTFVKFYQGFEQGDDPAYHGQLNEKRTRIDGVWWFPSEPAWRGTFMMVREVQRAATEKAQDADVALTEQI